MACPTAPCCEIRTLVLHTYPDGIKAYALARKLQGLFGTTVSVL